MTRASTGMLEKGTQTPSPAPDLIPARNRPRDGSLKAEIVSMEGCNENNSKCANRRLSQPRGSPQGRGPWVSQKGTSPEGAKEEPYTGPVCLEVARIDETKF